MLYFPLQDFGGSAKVARELYNMLQPSNADFVSEHEMREQLDSVLKLYLKKKDDDKSGKLLDFSLGNLLDEIWC